MPMCQSVSSGCGTGERERRLVQAGAMLRFPYKARLFVKRHINTDLRAARHTVAGTHCSPMCPDDRVDKCQPQPMSSRLSALRVALENSVQHFRRKPWPVIFNGE